MANYITRKRDGQVLAWGEETDSIRGSYYPRLFGASRWDRHPKQHENVTCLGDLVRDVTWDALDTAIEEWANEGPSS